MQVLELKCTNLDNFVLAVNSLFQSTEAAEPAPLLSASTVLLLFPSLSSLSSANLFGMKT